MYGYMKHYNYVPFKHSCIVDCCSKKHLLKNSQVDKVALSKLSMKELETIINERNIDIVEKIIATKIRQQNKLLYELQKQRKEKQSIINACKEKCKRKIIDIEQRNRIYKIA